jgi:predicted anti-sigma-YlaC factor YlaD
MSADHFSEKLVLLLDGDLGKEEKREVEAHLKRCKACARELELLRKTLLLTKADAAPEFKLKEWKEPIRGDLPGALRITPKRRRVTFWGKWAWVALPAAALVFTVIFGGDVVKGSPKTEGEQIVVAGSDSLSESEGQDLAILILKQDENLKKDLLAYEEQSPRNIYSYVGELGEDEEQALVSLIKEQFKDQEGAPL